MGFSNLEAPGAALRVCVNRDESGCLSGMVYSQRLTAPIPFQDIGRLILQLDQVLDRQNFPQAFQQSRSFTGLVGDVPASNGPEDGLPIDLVSHAKGNVCTFVVNVTSRRSATWQGWVDWLDGTPRERFSSALELLRRMEQQINAAQ